MTALRRALAVDTHAVLQAPPGAGKTTLVPLRLLEEPWLGEQRIVMLEPRRLATRAAARRMASMLGESVGQTVGFRTRDERQVGPATRVEVVTEGILTRRLQHDPSLAGVGLVIFDEFHERSLPGDLGLALALDVRRILRPELRLLVMSATIDGARVARVLGDSRDADPAPIVTSDGRVHPVEIRWVPRNPKQHVEPSVAEAIRRALRDEPTGDVLAFLPGEAEIRRTVDLLGESPLPGPLDVDVRPLYGALASADQDAALAPCPPGLRKVVLATDIAETSLTVEGVRIIVDAGLAKVPRYDARTGMTRLTTVATSRASADQRAGRAGRTEPGVAYRLWSLVEHGTRRPFADPEITQVDLAGLALELAAWGVNGPDALSALPFLDPPPARSIAEAHGLLRMLDALDADGRITTVGRAMVELPLHPRLARMIHGATEWGSGWLACVVAALLAERDVLRGRPDELPADLVLRVRLIDDPSARHPLADGRALRRVREQAHDLARRAGVEPTPGSIDGSAVGRVLAFAYPDRIAQARESGRGGFKLRTGTGAWVAAADSLATQAFLVAADLDGQRKDARIRLAAPLDALDVDLVFGHEVEESARLVWDRDRDDLVARVERRLGSLRLGIVERRPASGAATTTALLDRIRTTRLAVLAPPPALEILRSRVAFCARALPEGWEGEPWPDVSEARLVSTVDAWLEPYLAGARGRADLAALDLVGIVERLLTPPQRRALQRLAPASLTLPGGRTMRLDYSGEGGPVLSVKVQDLFGCRIHPTVADGRVPVVLHLLSPAGRPIQITSDLAGFWTGSWRDVRKDMAGRYPKHAWPDDPAAAAPPERGRR